PGLPRHQPAPIGVDSVSQRRHHAHAGYDDSSHRPFAFRLARSGVAQDLALLVMKLMASPTVWIFSAASSGISMLNSSSKAITSSTVSRESAPRSSMNLASSFT